jgi:hypothetical protein
MADMDGTEALRTFLSRALRKERRDRYLFLMGRSKGRDQFLADLHHAMGEHFDASRAVPSLSDEIMNAPAYSYSEQDGFGREEESVSAACDRLGAEGGWLVVDRHGRHGVYAPEDDMDGRMVLSV